MPVSKKPTRPKAPAKRVKSASAADKLLGLSAMEGLLAAISGTRDDGALSRAQDLMYEAWEEPRAAKRVALAKKALALAPHCADAWVLLAQAAATAQEACALYQKGVEAGAAALGKDDFEDYTGHFWGFLETRPYMRARAGLAETLWTLGRHEEAIGHLQAMLELNPGDNQGLRYVLASHLLTLDDVPALQVLLDQHDDGGALWLYTQALVAFKMGADNAAQLAKEAFEANRYVPAVLAGKKAPVPVGPFMSSGGEDEAAYYVAENHPAWTKTPGAIEWLFETTASASPRKPAKRGGK